MEHIFISNGQTQLVLLPENDTDRTLLDKLLSEGPVVIERIRNPLSILGHSVQDAVIIRHSPSPSKNDTSKKQAMQEVSTTEAHMEVSR